MLCLGNQDIAVRERLSAGVNRTVELRTGAVFPFDCFGQRIEDDHTGTIARIIVTVETVVENYNPPVIEHPRGMRVAQLNPPILPGYRASVLVDNEHRIDIPRADQDIPLTEWAIFGSIVEARFREFLYGV